MKKNIILVVSNKLTARAGGKRDEETGEGLKASGDVRQLDLLQHGLASSHHARHVYVVHVAAGKVSF